MPLDTVLVCSCDRRFWYLVDNDDGLHMRCTGCQQRIAIQVFAPGEEGGITEAVLDYGLRASIQPLPDAGLPPYTTKGRSIEDG